MFVLKTQSSDNPVLLWLQGGPGGSSLFGALVENGPFGIDKNQQSELFFLQKNFCKSSAVCRVLPLIHINILRIYSCSFICGKYLVLTSENWRKGNDAASIRSPVVGEEIRPGHGLGSALYVFFSALSLLLGWQEEHPACKKSVPLISKSSQTEEGNWSGSGLPGSPGKWTISRRYYP